MCSTKNSDNYIRHVIVNFDRFVACLKPVLFLNNFLRLGTKRMSNHSFYLLVSSSYIPGKWIKACQTRHNSQNLHFLTFIKLSLEDFFLTRQVYNLSQDLWNKFIIQEIFREGPGGGGGNTLFFKTSVSQVKHII